MNEEEIMKKFNEAINSDKVKEYPTQAYKASNNMNLNNGSLNVADPLNVNITQAPAEKIDKSLYTNSSYEAKTNLRQTNSVQQPLVANSPDVAPSNPSLEGIDNRPDFTEQVGVNNTESFDNIKYIKKETKKKKNSININAELKTAIIIVIILLAAMYFMPYVISLFRRIFLGLTR